MLKLLTKYASCTDGATAVEYGILVGALGLTVSGIALSIGDNMNTFLSAIDVLLNRNL